MNRTWVAKGVVAMLLAVAAVAVAVPKDVREQTEASMLLTGKISINADGSVAGYEILQADKVPDYRSEEHTSELQSLMRISYAVFCLKKKKPTTLQSIIIRKATYLSK